MAGRSFVVVYISRIVRLLASLSTSKSHPSLICYYRVECEEIWLTVTGNEAHKLGDKVSVGTCDLRVRGDKKVILLTFFTAWELGTGEEGGSLFPKITVALASESEQGSINSINFEDFNVIWLWGLRQKYLQEDWLQSYYQESKTVATASIATFGLSKYLNFLMRMYYKYNGADGIFI